MPRPGRPGSNVAAGDTLMTYDWSLNWMELSLLLLRSIQTLPAGELTIDNLYPCFLDQLWNILLWIAPLGIFVGYFKFCYICATCDLCRYLVSRSCCSSTCSCSQMHTSLSNRGWLMQLSFWTAMCRLGLDGCFLLQVKLQLLPNPPCSRSIQHFCLTLQGNKANVFVKLKGNSSEYDQKNYFSLCQLIYSVFRWCY